MRRASKSAPEYFLLFEKPTTVNKNIGPTLNLVPKEPCQSLISELLWHLMTILYGLVVRWLLVSTNGITIKFMGVGGFKSSTLTVTWLSSWLDHPKLKKYSAFCVLYGYLTWFHWIKHISHSFWHWVTNHDVIQKLFKKWMDFEMEESLYNGYT